MNWKNLKVGLLLPILVAAGCMHLKGTVVDQVSSRPVRTAVFTVGRPDGIGVLETHQVNDKGAFDFSISTLDVHQVYVYDGAGSPDAALHLSQSELGPKMTVRLPRAPKGETPMVIPRE